MKEVFPVKIYEIDSKELGPYLSKLGKKALVHIKKNKEIYIQLGRYVIYGSIMLANPSLAALASALDKGGYSLYKKVVNVGKWIIIIKGVIDTIQNVLQGDLDSAKRTFMMYVIAYAVILALPWAMNEVETVFSDWDTGGAY